MLRTLGWTLLAGALATTAPAQDWPSPRQPYSQRQTDDPPRNWIEKRPGRNEAQRKRDGRQVWQYAVDNGGRFQDYGRGRWVQHRRGQSDLHYEETDRNREYVELYDRSRDMYVRLYDRTLYQTIPGQGFVAMFDGYWE